MFPPPTVLSKHGVVPSSKLPMTFTTLPWPSVTSSAGAPGYGGGQNCSRAGGAKNLWVRTGRFWNLDLGTYNVRTLASEGDLEVLFEELDGVKWDIIGLSEVRRTGEEFVVLKNGHILCYRGQSDKKEHGVGFLVNKELAGNIENFYSLNERVAGLIIKLNNRYRLKIIQVYAPTSAYDDEHVEKFYEDVEEAMKKHKTQYTFIVGDFNAKVGKKSVGMTALGNFGIDTRNERGEMLVGFAERNNLKIMNTFFMRKASRKWTWKSPNGETKNEIDFILTDRQNTVKNVAVLNKLKSSDIGC